MRITHKILFVPALLLGLAGMFLAGGEARAAASQVTEDNLPQLLEKALREHPDIVLDVLRRNSEAVLDIAQQGSNMRRKHNLEVQWREDMKTPKSVRLEGRPEKGGHGHRFYSSDRKYRYENISCDRKAFCQGGCRRHPQDRRGRGL